MDVTGRNEYSLMPCKHQALNLQKGLQLVITVLSALGFNAENKSFLQHCVPNSQGLPSGHLARKNRKKLKMTKTNRKRQNKQKKKNRSP